MEKKAASKAKPGDLVLVDCGEVQYEGVLLPRQSKAGNFLSLKLSSGYNIGIRQESVKKVQVLESKPAAFASKADMQSMLQGSLKGKISLLACGGTIANRVDYRTGAVHPAASPEELLEELPDELKAQVLPKMLFSMPSEDMSPAHWAELAKAAASSIQEGADGVVITHGTDTMHYTSAALSFMLQNLPCPVILTGSQRSSDRSSSDAKINLQCALAASKSNLSGVFICMHENLSDDSCVLLFGTKARKMHTSRRDAFRPINVLPAARVKSLKGEVEKLSPLCLDRD
ncbi:MAG: Glu-tRNA(Gln) amidotransferase subunit GatD, partial [Candidatus Anstonellaceae archaeon]